MDEVLSCDNVSWTYCDSHKSCRPLLRCPLCNGREEWREMLCRQERCKQESNETEQKFFYIYVHTYIQNLLTHMLSKRPCLNIPYRKKILRTLARTPFTQPYSNKTPATKDGTRCWHASACTPKTCRKAFYAGYTQVWAEP
jgi:hypothetical protein